MLRHVVEGDGRHDEHRQQCGTGDEIALMRGTGAQQAQTNGEPERNGQALPEKMQERPAEAGNECFRCDGIHDLPLSSSSSSLRISASSLGEDFLAASACSTSFWAEPP